MPVHWIRGFTTVSTQGRNNDPSQRPGWRIRCRRATAGSSAFTVSRSGGRRRQPPCCGRHCRRAGCGTRHPGRPHDHLYRVCANIALSLSAQGPSLQSRTRFRTHQPARISRQFPDGASHHDSEFPARTAGSGTLQAGFDYVWHLGTHQCIQYVHRVVETRAKYLLLCCPVQNSATGAECGHCG